MLVNRRIKQIIGIVGAQVLALGLMVLAASTLAEFTGIDARSVVIAAGVQSAVECDNPEQDTLPAGSTDLEFLDLSVGWLRR